MGERQEKEREGEKRREKAYTLSLKRNTHTKIPKFMKKFNSRNKNWKWKKKKQNKTEARHEFISDKKNVIGQSDKDF